MEVILKKYIVFFLVILSSISVAAEESEEKSLLIIRSAGDDFQEVVTGLRYELDAVFTIVDTVLEENTKDAIASLMENVGPKVVVLMNNTQIDAYRSYQKSLDVDTYVPSVSLMAASVDGYIDGMKNCAAIEYEIPIVTSAVGLRSVFSVDIKKIGIVHRSYLNDFVKENRAFCNSEGIDLATEVVSDAEEVGDALNSLRKRDIDALWVANDNVLLSQKLIVNEWIPFVQKNKLPVIVGVESLVNPKFHFGNYAVVPDNIALGNQAANLIYDIMYNDWKVFRNGETQPPLSVKTVVNGPDARKFFDIDEEDLMSVDRVLE
ncbi:MAG: hypothetical protein ACQEQV_00100 [Fibrobacterota bacterium]